MNYLSTVLVDYRSIGLVDYRSTGLVNYWFTGLVDSDSILDVCYLILILLLICPRSGSSIDIMIISPNLTLAKYRQLFKFINQVKNH